MSKNKTKLNILGQWDIHLISDQKDKREFNIVMQGSLALLQCLLSQVLRTNLKKLVHECLQIEMPCTYLMAQKTKGRIQSETKAFYVEIKSATGSRASFISFMD